MTYFGYSYSWIFNLHPCDWPFERRAFSVLVELLNSEKYKKFISLFAKTTYSQENAKEIVALWKSGNNASKANSTCYSSSFQEMPSIIPDESSCRRQIRGFLAKHSKKIFQRLFLPKSIGSYFPAHAGRAALRRGDNDDNGSIYDKGMLLRWNVRWK